MAARRVSQGDLNFHIARYSLTEPPITCWAFAVIPQECKDIVKIVYYLGGSQICYETVIRPAVDIVAKIGTVESGTDLSRDICGQAFSLLEPATDNSLSWFLRTLVYLHMSPFMDEKACRKWLLLARRPPKPIRVFGTSLTPRSLKDAHMSDGDLLISRCLMESYRRRGLDAAGVSIVGLPPGNNVNKVDEGNIEPDFYLQWRKVDVLSDSDRRWQPVFTARGLITPLIRAAANKPTDLAREWPSLRGIDYDCLNLSSEDLEQVRDRQLCHHPDSFEQAWTPVVAQPCLTANPLNSEVIWTDICDLTDATMTSSATGRGREASGSAPRKASSSSYITRTAPSIANALSNRGDSIPASSQGDQRGRSTGPSSARDRYAPPKMSVRSRRSAYRAERTAQANRGEIVRNEGFEQVMARYPTLTIRERGGSSSDASSMSTPRMARSSAGL